MKMVISMTIGGYASGSAAVSIMGGSIDVADGQIPISCLLTSASLHDSQAAIPLATLSAERTTNSV